MRVCVLSLQSSPVDASDSSLSATPTLAAWATALGAERLSLDAFLARRARGLCSDVVLVEMTSTNLPAIASLGAKLQPRKGCLLVLLLTGFSAPEGAALLGYRQALASADLVLTTQATIARDVRDSCGVRHVFGLLPPQAAAHGAEDTPRTANGRLLSIVAPPGYTRLDWARDVGWLATAWAHVGFSTRIVSDRAPRPELEALLRDSSLVYMVRPLDDGGALAAWCARSGAVLLAPRGYDAARVTFPYTTFPDTGGGARGRRARLLLWLLTSREYLEFFSDAARRQLVQLRNENRRVAFFTRVRYLAPQHPYTPLPGSGPALLDQIHYRSGPRETPAGADACVLVCLVRNGREHLSSFMRHYRALGVRHFVFVDNGSDDGTLELLGSDPELTLYETALPHKHYENQIRRLIIERHCAGSWCLNVDIDELFDYPLSGKLPFGGLLRYLRQRGATAMAGHMLDMFARENRFAAGDEPGVELDLRSDYPYYDLSQLTKTDYRSEDTLAFCDQNELSCELPCFSGGVRQAVFGSKAGGRYLLIKHPLLFLDGELEPATHPHYSNSAKIADVSCVLYHYKFTPSFKAKALESRASARYVKFAQQQYEQYLQTIGEQTSLTIACRSARRLGSVDELVTHGFLYASPEFTSFAQRGSVEAAAHTELEAKASEPVSTALRREGLETSTRAVAALFRAR